MVEGDSKGTIDTVQVALRIRPLMQLETDRGCEECIDVVAGQPQVQIKDLAFTYNYVFPQHITQQEFYDTAVKGLIGKLFQGKCCLLSYISILLIWFLANMIQYVVGKKYVSVGHFRGRYV